MIVDFKVSFTTRLIETLEELQKVFINALNGSLIGVVQHMQLTGCFCLFEIYVVFLVFVDIKKKRLVTCLLLEDCIEWRTARKYVFDIYDFKNGSYSLL